jgi:hypothetical protein
MTQNERDLLLKDLCSRLPYGVKAHIRYWSNWSNQYYEGVFTVESVSPSTKYLHASSEQCFTEGTVGQDCDFVIEPYLFPLSSMTEEQEKELEEIDPEFYSVIRENGNICISMDVRGYDWLNKYHFDYRGLIPKGLAIDCTNLNIY